MLKDFIETDLKEYLKKDVEKQASVNTDDEKWIKSQKRLFSILYYGVFLFLLPGILCALNVIDVNTHEFKVPIDLELVFFSLAVANCAGIYILKKGIFYKNGNYELAQSVVKKCGVYFELAAVLGVFLTTGYNQIIFVMFGMMFLFLLIRFFLINKFVFECLTQKN